MTRRFPLTLLLLVALILSSCSLWRGKSESDDKQAGNGRSQQLSKVGIRQGADRNPVTDVEILWGIPAQPVDGFVIYYGYEAENLPYQQKVAVNDLGKFEDDKFGFVYRFVLKGIPANKDLKVSIAAVSDGKITAPSDVFTVQSGPIASSAPVIDNS